MCLSAYGSYWTTNFIFDRAVCQSDFINGTRFYKNLDYQCAADEYPFNSFGVAIFADNFICEVNDLGGNERFCLAY